MKNTGNKAEWEFTPGEVGDRLRNLVERNRKLSSELAEKDRQLQSILNSWSWKITAPVRRILGMMKKS
ncbi:MAG: hypothetical protein QY316_09715 [Thermodesulfobacteriota bacterium]|nr:MAG: hypothetical protein QY316_09715 [Thermodesulfobacteriota bacterium]